MNKIKYRFIPQIGKKPKIKGVGILCIDKGEACFFENEAGWNDRLLGVLKKAEVDFINSDGVKVKGFESTGMGKDGREKFRYMEWWCSFILDEDATAGI